MPGEEGTTNPACRREVHSPAGQADALIFDTDATRVRWEATARGPCKEIPWVHSQYARALHEWRQQTSPAGSNTDVP